MHTSKRMHFIEERVWCAHGWQDINLHTSKRMHFIEEGRRSPNRRASNSCIRQNVCTSLRMQPPRHHHNRIALLHTSKRMHFIEEEYTTMRQQPTADLHTSKRMHFIEELGFWLQETHSGHLHTSKRMHFIEDSTASTATAPSCSLHTSKRMHFIEERPTTPLPPGGAACIRQNVCTSLRTADDRRPERVEAACIRQNVCTSLRTMGRYWCRKNPTCLHTSKRMHFIEDGHTGVQASPKPRLHTSKRMHFIEEI